ncbi:aminodeoxychorismate synthase [Bordetella sp. H567]|uniref:aminodeoxychorismate synthase component I n=1 Tax=Bordetella sp. H567 TaxID=1697043 RepID=UPI00081CD90E|nr:aminodeoxychorismate synthase component I [Bordetella sp. H567]AOB30137.1 aminodeoxychorismate synthase [Bordetella sp. H567]
MFCRFEDRLAGRALQLDGARDRIEARTPGQLQPALDAIEQARRQGRWVALLLDFELGEWLLPLPSSPLPPSPQPERPRLRALVFDTARDERPWAPGADATGGIEAVVPRLDRARYLAHIEAIRHGIGEGAYYQVNYTMPLDMRVRGDKRALYARIAHRNPVAHAAYIEDADQTVLSFSPELFVARRDGLLTTRPMKGTAPRDTDPARDEALGQALLASEKNRAENLMIVDLLRNDLGRIAQPGSVKVEALFTLERYPTVWTMTSTITARAPQAGLGDVLRALFPCGSVTGAPKIAALSHLRQAEIAPRGLYCGSIGWLAPDGDFSLNVAIRTLAVDAQGRGVYGVGGGIVHDSDPASEWQECLWKARILDPERDPA